MQGAIAYPPQTLPTAAQSLVESLARSVASLRPAVRGLVAEGQALALEPAADRGYFSPAEEEALVAWFARLLTVREALWEVVDDASSALDGARRGVFDREEWRCFLAGYAGACLVVRLDRLVVEEIAVHTLVQRKLNEGSAERRIPRKQYTAIFHSLTDPAGAVRLLRAMRLLHRDRELAESLSNDPVVGPIAAELDEIESALDSSTRRYLKLLGAFGSHATRRGGASALQQTVSATLETSGRIASELRVRKAKRVLRELPQVRAALRPGDVLVTRHEGALTNVFLPGYWPHAALYVGDEAERRELGLPPHRIGATSIPPDHAVLEALKDGVLFRPLESTLAVDAVVVLRPRLPAHLVAQALERAAVHEGKLYNFDFDFFRSDRLVCTEVVYRAYDGLGAMRFELTERSGRPTLSAEDLLDAALDTDRFELVAIMGSPGCEERLASGPEGEALLRSSYRSSSPRSR